MRSRCSTFGFAGAAMLGIFASTALFAQTTPVELINPGGEAYVGTGTLNITPGGIDPIAVTGWDTNFSPLSNAAAQSIQNNPVSGARRLAFGSLNIAASPSDVLLYQTTSHVVAADQLFILNYFGRGFSNFENANDDQSSFFGYVDEGGVHQIDVKTHANVISGTWTSVSHTFAVPAGSELIGKNLTIGFFTSSLDGLAFSAVDDVALLLGTASLPGDANRDGVVNFADVQLIANNFLNTVPVSSLGDLTNDGLVDFADVRIWKDASGFAGSLEQALRAVPEPSAGLLVALAGIACILRRRA